LIAPTVLSVIKSRKTPRVALAPEVADHVAAVALFGKPSVRAMNFLGQPSVVIGPLY
jgi:hypothetical protein